MLNTTSHTNPNVQRTAAATPPTTRSSQQQQQQQQQLHPQIPSPLPPTHQNHHQHQQQQQQHHPARATLLDLFNLYLGRSSKPTPDDDALVRESPNKMQRRVTAPNRAVGGSAQPLPPANSRFLLDFDRLRLQLLPQTDQEQLQSVTESVLASLAVDCSGHAPQAEFIHFAAKTLTVAGYINYDSFLPALLSEVSFSSSSHSSAPSASSPSASAQPMVSPADSHSSNPASPFGAMQGIGSPSRSTATTTTTTTDRPIKSQPDPSPRPNRPANADGISYLRQLSCRIILSGLDSDLKPATSADILSHMLGWIADREQQRRQQQQDHEGSSSSSPARHPPNEWLRICLEVVWTLVDEDRCRIPFYELLRSGLQLTGNVPDDEALFPMVLEIHRRRDLVAMHMKMLDQHIQCPSFGTHRFLSHAYPAVIASGGGEARQQPPSNLRYSPITYPSILGEPLYGEDLANSIPKGSLDWERALRCLRDALRTAPSPEWWRRVLVVVPCYRQQAQQLPMPGAVFSPDMICEAVIDRAVELLTLTSSETDCWNEWLSLADVFFFLMKSGCIDFVDFVNKLSSRVATVDQHLLRGNHITWLLAQVIRIEIVMSTLSSDPRKVETTRKIISFHREDRSSDVGDQTPQGILLDFISSSQTLRIWSLSIATREYLNNEQIQKGKQIDEWLKQATKGDRAIDFLNMDDRTMGMLWVLSFTMAQPACEAIVNWFTSSGVTEVIQGLSNERMTVMRETYPLSITFLSGLSINLCLKLAYQLEEKIFLDQFVPSIAVVETYVRLLLVAPYSLFRPHFSSLTQRSLSILNKPGVSSLLLEILNYRLLPLYRYHGKHKTLMYDVAKIIAMIKGKRGEHRLFRLAENLCMNLILSMRDFFLVKKELKGPVEFTETLCRIIIISLAISIKTRGIAEVDHIFYVQHLLEQVMASCQHTWSEKTMRHFPPLIRDFLAGRVDKKAQAIQAWQQAEMTVINQCKQLLSSAADTYATTYLNCSFPQHRQYLCSGAWMLMSGRPENINSANLGRVLREFSSEEVTCNIYTMADILLHQIHVELQHGHPSQDLLMKATTNLSFLVWQQELLPLDILLLALIDRDDDPYALHIVLNMLDKQELQQRIKLFCANRGSPDHWLNTGIPKRLELQKALGNHLSWKDRYPVFYDDIAARLLPVIPLIIYRLIENDATEAADRVLAVYSSFLSYHPFRFTFVREILAYFYGHLPSKLIARLLRILDIPKLSFSESFPQYFASSNPAICPPREYFVNLLLRLVNNVIPPLGSKSKTSTTGDVSIGFQHAVPTRNQTASPVFGAASDGRGAFYQNQDTGTYTQLILETAVVEILSLPVAASQMVSSLLQIVVHIQPTLIQSNTGLQGTASAMVQGSALPTSPSAGSADSSNTSRSNSSSHVNSASNFMAKSEYSCQQLSCLMIQACGLLLSQLPLEFHLQLYSEASRIIKDCWWLNDDKRSMKELDSAIGYALTDPIWAAQDNTSTAIGNTIALLHSLFSCLPQEWLEMTHMVIKHLRPLKSVATLRIAFRILGPLFPRVSFVRPVFFKTIVLLFNCMVDVFGVNVQLPTPVEASEIADIIDFLHHVVMCEGQGGPVQAGTKPRAETLTLCGKAMEMLRPDVQHLLSHLRTDPTTSIYAATHPKFMQNPT